jgi:hypothetical protein
MRIFGIAAAAAAALAWAAPAYATGGMRCAPLRGPGPVLSLGITHGPVAQVFAARLTDGAAEFQTGGFVGGESRRPMTVGQSWIDRQVVWIDLLDEQAQNIIGQLRARVQPGARGFVASGTFVRNGRTWRVRCVEA